MTDTLHNVVAPAIANAIEAMTEAVIPGSQNFHRLLVARDGLLAAQDWLKLIPTPALFRALAEAMDDRSLTADVAFARRFAGTTLEDLTPGFLLRRIADAQEAAQALLERMGERRQSTTIQDYGAAMAGNDQRAAERREGVEPPAPAGAA